MPRHQAASVDTHGTLPQSRTEARTEIFATVHRETGPLVGLDGIRIDASVGSLPAMARLRSRYLCPAMLDLPGAGTGPVSSPLTTSELLVFASAERFEWVSLRGVGRAATLRRARTFLHPSLRLAVAPELACFVDGSYAALCHEADALVLDFPALARALGARRLFGRLREIFEFSALRDIPCMIQVGGLEADSLDPGCLSELLALGPRSLIVDATASPRAQATVDAALTISAPTQRSRRRMPRSRGASLAGRPTLGG